MILTGAGDGVFSADPDLKAAKAGLAVSPVWDRVSGAIANLPCLTIAALNGTLAGGAFGMVLACDPPIAVPICAVLLSCGQTWLPAATLEPRSNGSSDRTVPNEASVVDGAEIDG